MYLLITRNCKFSASAQTNNYDEQTQKLWKSLCVYLFWDRGKKRERMKAKKAHYQSKISSAGQAQKALFECVNELVRKTKTSTLPSNLPKEEQPNSFKNFFHEKIEKLQPLFTESIDSSRSPSPTVQQLQNLQPATTDEIRTLINKSPSKSCPLDPIPTFLLKDFLEELLPAITTIINASLNTASVPISFKKAVVTPLLKKQSLDPDVLGNYRPVSNLSLISKILEKVVAKRLSSHKTSESLYEPFQSAYRAGHSTETAVVRVQNDILEAIDSGKCVFLVLLDLSAAFDTVSHDILLDRLSTDSGISGSALSWISSYLTNRTQSVLVSGKYSDPAHLRYGVPQGSVLGPALFSDYSSPVASLIRSFNIIAHCYADDTQLYVPFTPGVDEEEVRNKLEDCIDALRVWMNKNRLKLNDKKTEFIIFGTSTGLKRLQQPPFVWVKRQFQHVTRCVTSVPCLTLKWKWIHKWTPCVRVRGPIYTRLGK